MNNGVVSRCLTASGVLVECDECTSEFGVENE
jgi:hypothetical protein